MSKKRENGQFFTKKNLFKIKSISSWVLSIPKLNKLSCVEPFAGEKDLKKFSDEVFGNMKWSFYDIDPQSSDIKKNDSIKKFPKGYDLCITNPPYLAKNSAKRRGLKYPETDYDDLYKLAIEKCLDNCDYVVAIIPESFITANVFHERLERVVSIDFIPFEDTEHPVCVAMFGKKTSKNFDVYRANNKLGSFNKLKEFLPKSDFRHKIKFNEKEGQISLLAVDNTKENSIRFCKKDVVKKEEIKVSSRARTRILLDRECVKIAKERYGSMDSFIVEINKKLDKIRKNTEDVFLTSFKGLRSDGKYRRRLDFKMAKEIIKSCLD